MLFRNLDENNDFTYGKGLNNFKTQNGAVGLNIKTRIQSWLNDCFFDLEAGIDWYNRLGSKNQRTLLEQDLKRIILQSEDVTGINSIDTNVVDRNFSASYDISTIYTQSFVDEVEVSI